VLFAKVLKHQIGTVMNMDNIYASLVTINNIRIQRIEEIKNFKKSNIKLK